MRLDPLALDELLEQSAVEATRGSVIDVLDGGLLAQSGIAQSSGQPLVAAMGKLAIEQKAEPIGVAECGGFAGGFQFGEGPSHTRKPELVQLVKCRMGQHEVISSVVVARSADIGMEQRHTVGGPRLWGLAIELVVEDRAHRAVGQRSNLDRPRGGGLEALGTEWPHQPDDAEAGAEALLWVGPALEDQLAQRGGGGADRTGLAANALDRPIGVSPMARRHVFGDRGVPVVAAGAQMDGDPLVLRKISTARGVSRTSTSLRAKR